jgi:hypothetical protein
MAEDAHSVVIGHLDAEAFVGALLEAAGVSKKNANIVARALVQADLRGVESHGINRIPSYLARIRNRVLDPKAEPTLTQVTPVVALVSLLRVIPSFPYARDAHKHTFTRSTATMALASQRPT